MVAEHGPQTSTSSLLEPEKVILYGKKDFADVIKLRTLGWGGYPGLSQWALNVITSALIKRRRQREIWLQKMGRRCGHGGERSE